jgi:molybdopterin-guanine dinucleotide biosynthesis protein A
MGTDKAFVAVDGVAMAERVGRALAGAGASAVAAIGGDARRLAGIGLAAVPDEWPGEGPLGGLATALGWSPEPLVMVAACDQPWLDGAAIRRLLAAATAAAEGRGGRGRPPLATVAAVEGVVQPLPGAYRRELRLQVETAFAAGRRTLGAALDLAVAEHRLAVVEVPAAGAWRDVDRPADLAGHYDPPGSPTPNDRKR